jgi:hypothetical protein
MQISKPPPPIISITVSAYYLGCAVGAAIASWLADKEGRKPSIFTCLITTSLGNILMFISGLSMHGFSPWKGRALACMLTGRVALGLGVGGIDAAIPRVRSTAPSSPPTEQEVEPCPRIPNEHLRPADCIRHQPRRDPRLEGVTVGMANPHHGHAALPNFTGVLHQPAPRVTPLLHEQGAKI